MSFAWWFSRQGEARQQFPAGTTLAGFSCVWAFSVIAGGRQCDELFQDVGTADGRPGVAWCEGGLDACVDTADQWGEPDACANGCEELLAGDNPVGVGCLDNQALVRL